MHVLPSLSREAFAILYLLTMFVATVLLARKSFMGAYTICHEALSQLGEELPESLNCQQISDMVEATSKMLTNISHADLLEMKEMDKRQSISMNIYSLMATAEHFAPVKPEMSTFIICRMVQYTMEKGLCKYSIAGFVQYAMLLCTSKITKVDIEGALRIAKAAMSCSKTRYDRTDQLPFLYCVYYGFVAVYTEPLQTCADMLRQGFDAGMSLGDTCNAFFNSVQHIKTAIIVGDRLPTLLKKVDYYLKLASTYQNETVGAFLSVNRDTISLLLGGEPSSTPYAIDVPTNTANAHILEITYYHRAFQAYWQGYSERCEHYIGKWKWVKTTTDKGRLQFIPSLKA